MFVPTDAMALARNMYSLTLRRWLILRDVVF